MLLKKSDFNKLMSLTKESLDQLSLFDLLYFKKTDTFHICLIKNSEKKVIKKTIFKRLSREEISNFFNNLPFDPKLCHEKLDSGDVLHRYCNPNHIYMVIKDTIFQTGMIYFLLREDKKLKKHFAHNLTNNQSVSLHDLFIKSDNYVFKNFTYFSDDAKSKDGKVLYPIYYWVKNSKLASYDDHFSNDTMFRFNDIKNNKTVWKFYLIHPSLVEKVVSTLDKSKIILSKL